MGEVELTEGDKYWKLILPLDKEIDYHGRKLKFDRPYLKNIISAFDDKVMDQVAFQLANDSNEHDTDEDKRVGRHYDPQRFRGEIERLEIRDDRSDGLNGLWGLVSPNSDGIKVISSNPKLGVSASLREGGVFNGKQYPVVMRHVLGTLDPRIKGMGAWEKAEANLSNDDDKDEEVIDLTSPNDKTPGGSETKVEIDPERLAELEQLETLIEEEDAEFDAFVQEALSDESDEGVTAGLSYEVNDDPRIISLANEVAESRFDREADRWRREGVPNKMIELARPVLASGFDMDVQLSNGSKVDPRNTIKAILEEAKGTIDLSAQSTHTQSQEEVELARQNEQDAVKYFTTEFF